MTRWATRKVYREQTQILGSVQDSFMPEAMVVISPPRLQTCHDTVVGFICQAGCAIRRVRLRLSDASGVAVEDKIWLNDGTDVTALAEGVAEQITLSTGERSDLEALIIVSDSR